MDEAPGLETLRVFPLTGTLLLPGTYLPLNIFEPRYRNMVSDALESDRVIGMVQPEVPGPDNWGLGTPDGGEPKLYPVGCKGRISRHQRLDDGRYLIVLEGLSRYRIVRELEPERGYRRVEADLGDYEIDADLDESIVDATRVLALLDPFAERKGLTVDEELRESLPGGRLINMLSTLLPFAPAEKQALLEARAPQDRAELLATLMGIELESGPEDPRSTASIH